MLYRNGQPEKQEGDPVISAPKIVTLHPTWCSPQNEMFYLASVSPLEVLYN